MGVDLTVYAERKGASGWEACEITPTGEPLPLYEGRNYVLGDILAGRFNGSYSQGHVIERARGLPEDLSEAIRKEAESFEKRRLFSWSKRGMPDVCSWLWAWEVLNFERLVSANRGSPAGPCEDGGTVPCA